MAAVRNRSIEMYNAVWKGGAVWNWKVLSAMVLLSRMPQRPSPMEHASESVRQSPLENRSRLVNDIPISRERFPACRLTWQSSTTTTAWGRQSDDGFC
jgi:hypothetical protein